jgi:outer membrane lipoprotein-sorting protein
MRPRVARPWTGARPTGAVDPAAFSLLQQMLNAEKVLVLSGTQTTILYRPQRTVTSQQFVVRNGDHAYRMEYQSPKGMAGQIVVDNGQLEWHYFPGRKTMEIAPSRISRLRSRIGPVLQALRRGQLNAQVTGQDQVAGHAVAIVQVNPLGAFRGSQRYWIDPTNGAQLKIETYGPNGQLESTSYYTQITYNAPIDRGEFAAPQVPPDTRTMSAPAGQPLPTIPSDTQAGFHVLQPTYLPAGYHFQSASQTKVAGEPLIGLQYGDGVTVISLYENPMRRRQPDRITQPRHGVVIVWQSGVRLFLIANLANGEMTRIAQSLR